MQHSGIVLNQCEVLSYKIMVACSAQSIRMAMPICHNFRNGNGNGVGNGNGNGNGNGVGYGNVNGYGHGHCHRLERLWAAKRLVFMQFVGNLPGLWWWR